MSAEGLAIGPRTSSPRSTFVPPWSGVFSCARPRTQAGEASRSIQAPGRNHVDA